MQAVCYHEPVKVKVLFFGMVKDIVSASEATLTMPEGAVLSQVFDHYETQFPALSNLKSSVVLARNQEFVPLSTHIQDQDEIAFLPPVSGGTGQWIKQITLEPAGHFFALTRQPIHADELRNLILQDQDGAICTFEGVTRNNSKGRTTRFLEYECYESMAIKLMAQIGQEIAAEHGITRIAIVHRLGHLEIGEASVLVMAAAPHRGASFDATRAGIDRLKKTVPIWKKEFFSDGEVWVDGEWDNNVLAQQ